MAPRVKEHLSVDSGIVCVTYEEVFAGKICAALSRQNPRDLFDVMTLYEHGGVSDELFKTFLVYVASDRKPAHELLRPGIHDVEFEFKDELDGLAFEPVSSTKLQSVRQRLIKDLQIRLRGPYLEFLLSLHDGIPAFGLIDRPGAEDLPAVRWKLFNLHQLRSNNPEKHARLRNRIEDLENTRFLAD